MTNDERLAMIKQKIQSVNEEVTELYDFIAMVEALTTDKHTAARIRGFMEAKGAWEKLEK